MVFSMNYICFTVITALLLGRGWFRRGSWLGIAYTQGQWVTPEPKALPSA